ncbi:hypothetical protein D3C75_909910 [compost metagenome]
MFLKEQCDLIELQREPSMPFRLIVEHLLDNVADGELQQPHVLLAVTSRLRHIRRYAEQPQLVADEPALHLAKRFCLTWKPEQHATQQMLLLLPDSACFFLPQQFFLPH